MSTVNTCEALCWCFILTKMQRFSLQYHDPSYIFFLKLKKKKLILLLMQFSSNHKQQHVETSSYNWWCPIVVSSSSTSIWYLTSQAPLWTLWMAISSSVNILAAGSFSAPLLFVTASLKGALLLSFSISNTLLPLTCLFELSSDKSSTDVVMNRFLNWTWRKISLLSSALRW